MEKKKEILSHENSTMVNILRLRFFREDDRLFEARVEKTPDAVAVVYEDKQLTCQQLNRLARHLIVLGVAPDTRWPSVLKEALT